MNKVHLNRDPRFDRDGEQVWEMCGDGVVAGPANKPKQGEAPEPTAIEVPMRRTGSSWLMDCQNWEPPVR